MSVAMRGARLLLALLATPGAAATTLDDCAARVNADPHALDGYRCYWFVARNGGPWDVAVQRLQDALAADPRNDHPRLILGAMAADHGEARAEPLLRAAAAGYARRSGIEGEVHARVTLAVFLRKHGHHDDAGAELDRALARAQAAGRADLEPGIRIQAGWQKYYARDYGGAWVSLREAERLVFPGGSMFDRLETADGLAATSWALGRHAEAQGWYERELALLAGRDPFRAAFVRRNMALVVRELVEAGEREADELAAVARSALEQALSAGNRPAEIGARLLLAQTLPPAEAAREALTALAASRAAGSVADQCWALCAVGETTLALDPARAVDARARFDEAIALARASVDAEALAEAAVARSRASRRAGPRAAGLADGEAALDAIEAVRGLQGDRGVRSRVFARFASFYREHAAAILDGAGTDPPRAEIERAFVVAERMRARALLETMDAAGVAPARNAARVAPELAAVQSALAPDQALLAFILPRSPMHIVRTGTGFPGTPAPGGWVFAITASAVRVHRIADPGSIEREALVFVSMLARRDGAEAAGAARLHAGLLKSALDALPGGVRRLVIVPDGVAHVLPLETLRAAPHDAPVAAWFELTLVPSAAAWLRWRNAPSATGPVPVLSFADPAAGAGDAAKAVERVPLPWARREAQRLVDRCGGDSVLRTGSEATESAWKHADLARYRVLHLATHAWVDVDHPERSAIILAPGAGADDGLLQYREIVELSLRGQAVLLPACRSASGPVVGGEGVLGLPSAFLEAGAGAVVAARWAVRDGETSQFMALFTDRLAAGESLSSALASARRDLIRRGAPPATWASLAIFGNGDAAPLPPNGDSHHFRPEMVTVTFFVLVAAGGGIVRIVRRRVREHLT